MVQYPIENGGSDDAIAEDLIPGAEALVGGEDYWSLLVTPADELEEQVRTGLVDGQITDLVDDQQAWHCVGLELVLELALCQGPGQGGDHVLRGSRTLGVFQRSPPASRGHHQDGNRHVRRILIEAAWNDRFPARLGETLQPRQIGQPTEIVDIAWKAQL